jgi:hypothetical protein
VRRRFPGPEPPGGRRLKQIAAARRPHSQPRSSATRTRPQPSPFAQAKTADEILETSPLLQTNSRLRTLDGYVRRAAACPLGAVAFRR